MAGFAEATETATAPADRSKQKKADALTIKYRCLTFMSHSPLYRVVKLDLTLSKRGQNLNKYRLLLEYPTTSNVIEFKLPKAKMVEQSDELIFAAFVKSLTAEQRRVEVGSTNPSAKRTRLAASSRFKQPCLLLAEVCRDAGTSASKGWGVYVARPTA